jgi:type VI secretion system protein ImpK
MHSHQQDQHAGPGDDLACTQFRSFAALLLHERAAAASLLASDGRDCAVTLSRALCQVIELQSLDAQRAGGCLDLQLQGRFLKAALADELMLNLDWPGRRYWRYVRIEAALLYSARASEQVFTGIDRLLSARDPAQRPLARLYMHLLALGFQGRYRGSASLAPIEQYRRELFRFAWPGAAGLAGQDGAARAPESRVLPRRWWLSLTRR